MLDKLFWPIYPIIVSGLGYICFKYPKSMRRIMLITCALLILFFTYAYAYTAGVVDMYEGGISQIDDTGKTLSTHIDTTTFYGKRLNENYDAYKVSVISAEQVRMSFIQYFIKPFIYVLYFVIGFIGVTYLSLYVHRPRPNSDLSTSSEVTN